VSCQKPTRIAKPSTLRATWGYAVGAILGAAVGAAMVWLL
jgi:hypothetical protein